jgi:hypothetical protein
MQATGHIAGIFPAAHLQLAVYTLYLGFDGINGNDQFLSNLGSGSASSQQTEDTKFLRTQPACRCCGVG